MKMFLYAFLIILGVAACSNEPEFREDVIERYEGGEKKVVVHYRGTGASELLVKRFTYDEYGDLILKEDLINNIELDWIQLHHPDLNTARGLENFLQGGWIFEQAEENGEYIEIDGEMALYVSGTIFTQTSKIDGQVSKDSHAVEYKQNHVIAMSQPESAGKSEKLEMIQLEITSKDTFSFAAGDLTMTFQRKNR